MNALCNNNQGSHTCTCKDSFQGNGISCTGKYLFENLWSFQLACITQRNRGDMLCVDEVAKQYHYKQVFDNEIKICVCHCEDHFIISFHFRSSNLYDLFHIHYFTEVF